MEVSVTEKSHAFLSIAEDLFQMPMASIDFIFNKFTEKSFVVRTSWVCGRFKAVDYVCAYKQ